MCTILACSTKCHCWMFFFCSPLLCTFFSSMFVLVGKCRWTFAQVLCGTLQVWAIFGIDAISYLLNLYFHFPLITWVNQSRACNIDYCENLRLAWLLLLLHHFELSEEKRGEKKSIRTVKEIFDRLLSAFCCIYFLCTFLYIFCCYCVYSLFQMLSLKWRRCQYNVEYSSQHAAESELT